MAKRDERDTPDLEAELARVNEQLAAARVQLETVTSDFEAYRQRTGDEQDRARRKGGHEVTLNLLDVVDDIDRALASLSENADRGTLADGVAQLRDRVLRHFEKLGYTSFADQGDHFDPNVHEAISVEAGVGPEGSILRVLKRGWEHEGSLVRPAMVTVLQGSIEAERSSSPHPRRRRAAIVDHICPFGVPGCTGDCAGCDPARHELLGNLAGGMPREGV